MKSDIVFLTNDQDLKAYWPLARPLLEKCVLKAVHGEYTVDDIKKLVSRQRAMIAMGFLDGKPAVALAIEWLIYPQLKVANIMALGGRDLMVLADIYWDDILKMLKSIGMQAVQCSCSRSMERFLRPFGFAEVYRDLRINL